MVQRKEDDVMLGKKKHKITKLELAQREAQKALKQTNNEIERLGEKTFDLHCELIEIQTVFDFIRNIPSEKRIEYEKLKKIRIEWKGQADKIYKDYNDAVAKNVGKGVAGVAGGAAVAVMGPTAAMGVATTFGVASTGTAISSLTGIAAQNAALAWLGGGALAAGGGGMAAGELLLALAGPAGWAIAGVSLLTSGIFLWKGAADKEILENIFTAISQRDKKSFDLATVELKERITRIDAESEKLKKAVEKIKTFGSDYEAMSEQQQYELGAYVNLMNATTQLLVNPIVGLQPKYTEEDADELVKLRDSLDMPEPGFDSSEYYDKFMKWCKIGAAANACERNKNLMVFLANFLYKIDLNEKEQKLLWKSLRGNKKMLEAMGVSKKEFDKESFEAVGIVLEYKYKSQEVVQNGEY